MERLRGVLASSGTGDRVLELLEQLRETQAEQLAEAICSVLEARTQNLTPMQNGVSDALSDVMCEIESVAFQQPNGTFDVVFYKESFVLRPSGGRGALIHIPYASIKGVASVNVDAEDVKSAAGLPEEYNDLLQRPPEGHLFLHLNGAASFAFQGRNLQSVVLKSEREVSVAFDLPSGVENVVSGNIPTVFSQLLQTRLPANVFDTLSSTRTYRGCSFFSTIYEQSAGHLFLMERSVCLEGNAPLYLLHKNISSIGLSPIKEMHFTLRLYVNRGETVHKLRCLPFEDREPITHYFHTKEIPIVALEDVKFFTNVLKHGNAQDNTLGLESRAAASPDANSLPSRRIVPERQTVMPANNQEMDALMSSLPQDVILDTSSESESESSVDASVDEMDMLLGEDLPDQDDEDDDYSPERKPDVSPQNNIEPKIEPLEEGCLLRNRWIPDEDLELIEIDTDSDDA